MYGYPFRVVVAHGGPGVEKCLCERAGEEAGSCRALSDKEDSIRTNRGIEGDCREVLLSSGYSFGTFLGCMARLLVCGGQSIAILCIG